MSTSAEPTGSRKKEDHIYLRLAREIADKIISGELPPGTKLKPHRDLAHDRRVTVGTVSRAYAELQRAGLIDAGVGRGSFVRTAAAGPAEPATVIDLRANRPPMRRLAPELLRSIGRETARFDESLFEDRLILSDDHGHDRATKRWLEEHHGVPQSCDAVLCSSGQHALHCALMMLCRPGSVVVTEHVTYIGLIMLAHMLGLRLVGVAADEHGLVPEALAQACERERPTVLVCTPNFHSPTTATMPEERRHEIADLAQRHQMHVVEDDVYGAYMHSPPPPFRVLLPERSILFTSFSKVLAPGIAVGLISAPDYLMGRIYEVVRITGGMVDPLSRETVTQWIADGTMDRLIAANLYEIAARVDMARAVLGEVGVVVKDHCPHAWLPLPATASLSDFISRLLGAGIHVVGSDQFTAGRPEGRAAIRISLSAARGRADLARALDVIRNLFDASPGLGTIV